MLELVELNQVDVQKTKGIYSERIKVNHDNYALPNK